MKETFESSGCLWEVVKHYRISEAEAREAQLIYRDRIRIRCIRSNGCIPVGFEADYADTSRRFPIFNA